MDDYQKYSRELYKYLNLNVPFRYLSKIEIFEVTNILRNLKVTEDDIAIIKDNILKYNNEVLDTLYKEQLYFTKDNYLDEESNSILTSALDLINSDADKESLEYQKIVSLTNEISRQLLLIKENEDNKVKLSPFDVYIPFFFLIEDLRNALIAYDKDYSLILKKTY